jgi:hypothetical protein
MKNMEIEHEFNRLQRDIAGMQSNSSRPQQITVNSTVTEKRAPTDESVALLREMEAESLKSVLGAIRLDDNTFNAVVVFKVAHSMMSDQVEYFIEFLFNGKRYRIKETLHGAEGRNLIYKAQKESHQAAKEVVARHVGDLMGRQFAKMLYEEQEKSNWESNRK